MDIRFEVVLSSPTKQNSEKQERSKVSASASRKVASTAKGSLHTRMVHPI